MGLLSFGSTTGGQVITRESPREDSTTTDVSKPVLKPQGDAPDLTGAKSAQELAKEVKDSGSDGSKATGINPSQDESSSGGSSSDDSTSTSSNGSVSATTASAASDDGTAAPETASGFLPRESKSTLGTIINIAVALLFGVGFFILIRFLS